MRETVEEVATYPSSAISGRSLDLSESVFRFGGYYSDF